MVQGYPPSLEDLRRQLDDALGRWAADKDRLFRLESELRRLLRESAAADGAVAAIPAAALRAALWPALL